MKNNKDIKKLWLSIGYVALATLPVVGVISCSSNNSSSNENNGGTNDNNGSNNPAVEEKEILYYKAPINEVCYEKDGWVHEYTFINKKDNKIIFDKIKNNQIKFFDKNGNQIKYQVTINLDAGLMMSDKETTDISKGYINDQPDWRDNNMWKTIKGATSTSFIFYKKINNDSFTQNDFQFDGLKNGFDLNNNFLLNLDDKNNKEASCLGVCLGDPLALPLYIGTTSGSSVKIDEHPELPWTSEDNEDANYLDLYGVDKKYINNFYFIDDYFSNVSGTISIKQVIEK